PGTADVREDGAADAGEAERIPVGKVSLLDGEEQARVARLVAKRVTSQAAVPSQLDRVFEVQLVAELAVEGHEEQPLARDLVVVACVELHDGVLPRTIVHTATRLSPQQEGLAIDVPEPPAGFQ